MQAAEPLDFRALLTTFPFPDGIHPCDTSLGQCPSAWYKG